MVNMVGGMLVDMVARLGGDPEWIGGGHGGRQGGRHGVGLGVSK